jgi:hypothetical protein
MAPPVEPQRYASVTSDTVEFGVSGPTLGSPSDRPRTATCKADAANSLKPGLSISESSSE